MEIDPPNYDQDQYLQFEMMAYEEDERVRVEVDDIIKKHLFELFKKLQQKRHIKITATATRVRLDYIEENSQPQSTKRRRIQEVLEAAKVTLRELNSDPVVITGLPVQENVEYLWNQYQSLNEEDKAIEWLWLHFAIGKVIDQHYQLLRDRNIGKNDYERRVRL